MKRRQFLTAAAAGAGAAAVGGAMPAPAIAQGLIEWRMVTCWPRNLPAIGVGAQRLADAIGEMSDGRLTVKLFAAGELVPAFEAFDAVRDGVAECCHDAPYYWIAKHGAMPFFCSVPGGFTPPEHNAWILYGGGQALWDELYADFGLRGFLAGTGGPNMGGWFRKSIDTIDDLDGLKMRIPGLGAIVLNRLGAIAVNLPGGEVLPSLQTGVIDATEWAGPYNDLAMGFHKVAPYYYGPGVHEPGPALSLTVSRAAWDALPSDLQAVVRMAAGEENMRMYAETMHGNAVALDALINQHGVDVRHFPDSVLRAMLEQAVDVVGEAGAADDISRRTYESWTRFRDRMVMLQPYVALGYLSGRAAFHG